MERKTVREMDAQSLKAFTHPVRMRLYELLEEYGAATATMLAERIDENTGVTSYHLRQLAKHGLIVEVPEKARGKERWWRAAGFSTDTDKFRKDPDTAEAAEVLMAGLVRQRHGELNRWVEESRNSPREWIDAATHTRRSLRLRREHLAELGRRVSELLDSYADDEGGERVVIHFDAFPLGQPER
ncbi:MULTISPECIES: winged helix-turn-helix domain-containing protein [Nonomuraea]|uniref:Winged helix-turn-helix domain-containing protein n=1 Tax=Nonomuraea mangrovi TaxID=2316207 RepID=A0ABW4T6K7_9ACTN